MDLGSTPFPGYFNNNGVEAYCFPAASSIFLSVSRIVSNIAKIKSSVFLKETFKSGLKAVNYQIFKSFSHIVSKALSISPSRAAVLPN